MALWATESDEKTLEPYCSVSLDAPSQSRLGNWRVPESYRVGPDAPLELNPANFHVARHAPPIGILEPGAPGLKGNCQPA
jgi:hypothetical protein